MQTGLQQCLLRADSTPLVDACLATNTVAREHVRELGLTPDACLELGRLPPSGARTLVIDITDGGNRADPACGWLWALLQHAHNTCMNVRILDRPNPLDGVTVEGPLARAGHTSHRAPPGLPLRHGMTPAEMVRFWIREQGLPVDLEITRLLDWDRRSVTSEDPLEIGLQLLRHAGLDVVASEVIQVRGLAIDPERLVHYCKKAAVDAGLEGVAFSISARDESTRGLVVDPNHPLGVDGLLLALVVLEGAVRSSPGGMQWHRAAQTQHHSLDALLGSPDVRLGLDCRVRADELHAQWQAEAEAFTERRRASLLY